MGRRHRQTTGDNPYRRFGAGYALAFCPDGKAFVTASYRLSSRSRARSACWDAASAKPIGQPISLAGVIYCVVPSPDGKTIVTGCGDTIHATGRSVSGTVPPVNPMGQPLPHAGLVYSVAFSPDGRLLADRYGTMFQEREKFSSGRRRQANRWERPSLSGGLVWQVAFSPDGRRFSRRV